MMKYITFTPMRLILAVIFFMMASGLNAQEKAENTFTLKAKVLSRGEFRAGGFKADALDNTRVSHFVLGSYRLTADYQRSWLELRLSPQHAGVWGQASGGVSIFEAWAKLKTENGWFAKFGRQALEYDDERIIGNDDWTMTAPTHDVLKLGFDGTCHKVHLIIAYNQNPENTENGQTYYSGGIQPYKSMQTLWYHYNTPKKHFGISLLAMNLGVQNDDANNPEIFYQMLVGSYLAFRPEKWSLEGSYYYQTGQEEHGLPLDAFMGSVKLNVKPKDTYSITAGYDYLSGDKYFAVPPIGGLGLVQHDKVRGFSALFGSHHEFYGAMDFFYVSSYVNGFTPGLQNLYAGGTINPTKKLSISGMYHYLSIATTLNNHGKSLGHEIECSASYAIAKDVKLSAGYTFMQGTETMEYLQHVNDTRKLHWGWLMVSVSPSLFSTSF